MPGVHVLRRSATEVQVGLDPDRAVILPDEQRVRALLSALSSPAGGLPADHDPGVLALLHERGLVVDADALLPLVPTTPAAGPPGVARSDVASAALCAGDRVATVIAARAASEVDLVVFGGEEAEPVAARLGAMVTESGGVWRRVPTGEPPSDPGGVGLLVGVGEPHREYVDTWQRDGTPHLVLRLTEGRVVIGPFVLPGSTACLRCVDAHHTDLDPAWPLLVEQYATATARPRDDTLPEPVDAPLATLGAAWAVRELMSHLEGRTPATASTTITLDAHLTSLESQTWARHPGCGCTWG